MTFAPQKDEAIGTINSVISRGIVRGVYNDGDNTYMTIRQEARNSLPLTSPSSTLIIPLTNPNVDFVQFDKSFIRIDATVTMTLDGFQVASQEDDELLPSMIYLFIGLKHSSDFIGEYAVYHKGKQVSGTLQSNATVESFLYHTFRSSTDISNRTGIHSLAEKIAQGDNLSMCGQYVHLNTIQDAVANHESLLGLTFHLDIPFNDILIFQQFQSYPAALFGDLEIRIKVNPRALVCLQCNPLDTIKQAIIQSGMNQIPAINNECAILGAHYTRDYTQLGDTFNACLHAQMQENSILATFADVSIRFNAITIDSCYSVITGYRAKPESLEKMRAKFEKYPWVKFSQNVNYLQFSQKPSPTGFEITQQVYLNNTTDFLLLFPTTANEAGGTVYKNPMLSDLSLIAMNRKYPEVGLRTDSPEFIHMMLNSSRGTPQKEYADSLGERRWNAVGHFGNDVDRTSFVVSLKVERPSAMGLICDGLDSKGYQVPIRLHAVPTYGEGNEFDEYCGDAANMPPPILVTVNDSYFIFNSKDGGQCLYSNRSFNDTVKTFMDQ